MKRTGFLIERIADLDNLYEAFRRACRGKQRKKEVLRFREHFDENIATLRRSILAGNVDVGNYHYFTIYDPKERVICAADFQERVLHHAIINVCHDLFDRTLIDTTYATRKGKGVYAAIDKAVEACSKYAYTAKLDFRKYYDSIDHDTLRSLLRRRFKDRLLLRIFDEIIDSYCVVEGRGLPIGNLTSQYFANAYLSPLDHYAKEVLHARVYIRYMDDILIADNDRSRLKEIVRAFGEQASAQLHLTLKPPMFRRSKEGQTFLGYRILPHHYRLAGRSKKRYRTKLAEYLKNFEQGRWDELTYQEHLLPLTAFVMHAVSRKFRGSCIVKDVG